MSLFEGKPLVIASHNAGKLAEIRELTAPLHIEVKSAADFAISEPEETGDSFAANAELKARHTYDACKHPSLADDSGLVILALDGAPGIYSARWAGPDKDFQAAFARIRRELSEKNIEPNGTPAYFISVLALCLPDGAMHLFEGRIYGTLTFPPRGEKGFGYDPIFTPDGFNATFGEISPEEKNKISHRAVAFAKFLDFLSRS